MILFKHNSSIIAAGNMNVTRQFILLDMLWVFKRGHRQDKGSSSLILMTYTPVTATLLSEISQDV
jgi:hypothetical protein